MRRIRKSPLIKPHRAIPRSRPCQLQYPLSPTSNGSIASAAFVPKSHEARAFWADGSFSVYPNPNMGTFTVRVVSESVQTAEIKLTDAPGRTVCQTRAELVAGTNDVDVALKTAPGIYVLTLTAGKAMHTTKVSVE